MRILFIGDVVGSPYRDMVKEYVPKLKTKYKPHFTIINGENAAWKRPDGKNLSQLNSVRRRCNHNGEPHMGQKEIFDFIDDVPNLVRPANFPEGTPGKGITYVKANGKELAVINLQGRTFCRRLMTRF